jgi:hypothetical protein
MDRTARSVWMVALSLTTAFLAPSCGGDDFTTPSASEGGAPEGGAPEGGAPEGGSGGSNELPDAGNGGAQLGGEMGDGGASSESCETSVDCEGGRFCRDGSCASCADRADLASLAFGQAEPLETINDTAGDEGLRFARRLPDGIGLAYVRDFFGGTLWLTSDPEASAGAAVTKTDAYETGALPLSRELPEPLMGFDFFFSRRSRVGTEPLTTLLFGAKLSDELTLSEAAPLPAPFNSDQVVASHGLALSSSRAVWTRNSDGQLAVQLVTSPLPPSGEPTPLSLPLPDGCGFATELDYSPWLSPDGRLLLFAARRIDRGCKPPSDAISHIYALELSAAGQPIGNARLLGGMLDVEVRQTDASLSPDGCELLFSAQTDGPMRLYRAARVR